MASGDAIPAPRRDSPIGVFLQCTNLGGMERVAYSLFDRLAARGFDLRIATPRPWGLGEPLVKRVDAGAEAFDYRGKFGWRSFRHFHQRTKVVGENCDCLWVIGTCASCLAAARMTGRPALLSHHYAHFENRASWLRWMGFYLAFGAGLDGITYPTEFTRNEAIKIAPWLEPKTHVVRNGFDVHYFGEEQRLAARRAARAELQIPPDAFLVGNGGWLIRSKRFDVFLKTARHVLNQIPNALFHICGGGPEETHLRELARQSGIASQVHFAGWVKNMTPYYQAWDVQLFNTDFDALGCTPLEAASHGCLCVASCTYGGLWEFIKDGRTGFIIEQHDEFRLADAIARLARNPGLALQIRQRAARLLQRKFNHESALKFYENYFQAHTADRRQTAS
jgi:glycosyltransferase involved in cell wall biosynthesis